MSLPNLSITNHNQCKRYGQVSFVSLELFAIPKEVAAGRLRSQKKNAEGIENGKMYNIDETTWSTEKKYMNRYRGIFDIFFGVEHRMKNRRDVGAVQQRGRARVEICR